MLQENVEKYVDRAKGNCEVNRPHDDGISELFSGTFLMQKIPGTPYLIGS